MIFHHPNNKEILHSNLPDICSVFHCFTLPHDSVRLIENFRLHEQQHHFLQRPILLIRFSVALHCTPQIKVLQYQRCQQSPLRIILWIVSTSLLAENNYLNSFVPNFKIENENTTIWIKVALFIFFRMFQLCPEYVWGHLAVSYLLESVLQYACGTRNSS